MVVDAVLSLDQNDLNERNIGIKKVPGGGLQDSLYVDGVAFKKTVRSRSRYLVGVVSNGLVRLRWFRATAKEVPQPKDLHVER